MERRTKKMLLAILMILSILATDFFVLGSGIMTYASHRRLKKMNKKLKKFRLRRNTQEAEEAPLLRV